MPQEETQNICPICGKEIAETEETAVCPDCSQKYHKACFSQSGGCVTPNCPGAKPAADTAQNTPETAPQNAPAAAPQSTPKFCVLCGETIAPGAAFCPSCGRPTEENPSQTAPANCPKCGAAITPGTAFCPSCGQKISEARPKKKGKKTALICGIAATVAALAVLGVIFVPKLLNPVGRLCAQGRYEEAYEKAKKDEDKEQVKLESFAAQLSMDVVNESISNPDTFTLQEAYYYAWKRKDGEIVPSVVLLVRGDSEFGADTLFYSLITYYRKDSEWQTHDPFDDLTPVEVDESVPSAYDMFNYTWDDMADIDGIAFIIQTYNADKEAISNAMSTGTKLNEKAVNRINTMYQEGTLKTVKALSVDS